MQGLPGKLLLVFLFSVFYHLFTDALVFGTVGKKKNPQQKNNRAYTDIAAVKEEDQVSLCLRCK